MPTKVKKVKTFQDLEALARGYTEISIKTVGGLAQHAASESVRLEANRLLMDRGWGKPVQRQEHSGKDGSPIVVQIIQAPYDDEDG